VSRRTSDISIRGRNLESPTISYVADTPLAYISCTKLYINRGRTYFYSMLSIMGTCTGAGCGAGTYPIQLRRRYRYGSLTQGIYRIYLHLIYRLLLQYGPQPPAKPILLPIVSSIYSLKSSLLTVNFIKFGHLPSISNALICRIPSAECYVAQCKRAVPHQKFKLFCQ